MRIVAIFFVILLHASYGTSAINDYRNLVYAVGIIYNGISRFAVPILVMISGALFLNLNKKITLQKNILRLVIAFLFWSFGYAFILTLKNGWNLPHFIERFFIGHVHLWYLHTILGIYLCIPILRNIVTDKKLEEYTLILWAIFSVLFPFIHVLVLNLELSTTTTNITTYFLGKICFLTSIWYVGYFVLGHYLHTYEIKTKYKRLIYILASISLLFTILAMQKLSIIGDLYLYRAVSPNIGIYTIAIFIFIKDICTKIHFSQRQTTLILWLSQCSFGVYLVHMFILPCMNRAGFTISLFNPIFSIPIQAILVFIISLAVIAVLKKISIVNKFII